MLVSLEDIRGIAAQNKPALVEFTQQLVTTPSLPGQEQDVAAIVSHEMTQLGYDEVYTDHVGNVIGRIYGEDGPTVMLNGHMDHVDAGPADGWPYPPFSGQVVDDELWGRGSVDMKGPVACMIYAAGLFKRLDFVPSGDILMTVPVMEEVGGLGTQFLASQLNAQAAICGEPSNNTIRRGHRGRVEVAVTLEGVSAHASAPHLGVNPHFAAAAFLSDLSSIELASDEALGQSTVAPTIYATDQTSRNVIPGRVYLTLDWRSTPTETPETIVKQVQKLIDARLSKDHSQITTRVAIASQALITYTGVEKEMPSIFPSYLLPEDDRLVQAAHEALETALNREVGIDVWRFATDGGHLMAAGIPTIGFGPGDDALPHTNQERISIAQMEEALVGYAALILALAEAES